MVCTVIYFFRWAECHPNLWTSIPYFFIILIPASYYISSLKFCKSSLLHPIIAEDVWFWRASSYVYSTTALSNSRQQAHSQLQAVCFSPTDPSNPSPHYASSSHSPSMPITPLPSPCLSPRPVQALHRGCGVLRVPRPLFATPPWLHGVPLPHRLLQGYYRATYRATHTALLTSNECWGLVGSWFTHSVNQVLFHCE